MKLADNGVLGVVFLMWMCYENCADGIQASASSFVTAKWPFFKQPLDRTEVRKSNAINSIRIDI